jgi:hypothetical protein
MTKKVTAKKIKRNLIYKKESERTKSEKLVRAIVCLGVVVYTAVLGYLLMNAHANLAQAEADFSETQVECAAQK